MKRQLQRKSLIVLIIFMGCLLTPSWVFADGDGTGGGTGGGRSQPVSLALSTPKNGSSNVPIDTVIKLTFNKNVVNFTVKENNIKCFALKDSAGKNVDIEVEMGDDQINPAIKQNITIRPNRKLSEGTIYTLTISKNLTAKNANILGQDVTLKFRCAGAGTEKENELWKAIQSEENPNEITIYLGGSEYNDAGTDGTKSGKTSINGGDTENGKTVGNAVDVAGTGFTSTVA